MKQIHNTLIIISLLLSQLSCAQTTTKHEQTLCGIVIKVDDGDTFDLLLAGEDNRQARQYDNGKLKIKKIHNDSSIISIRMSEIDAPEKGQDFSKKAKEYLRDLCLKKTVTIKFKEIDHHGRFVAHAYLDDGKELCHEMVKAGFAWHFKEFSNNEEFSQLEKEAQKNHIGLWADKYPVEPWFERHLRRKGYKSPEIKQLKKQGMIDTWEEVKRIKKY